MSHTETDESQPEDAAASRLLGAVERLSGAVRALLREAARAEGLSVIQSQFLTFIATHDEALARVTTLSREFGLTPATVSAAVSTLVEKGLLTRRPAPEGGRAQSLELSTEGADAADRLAGWAAPLRRGLAGMDPGGRGAALEVMLGMIRSLENDGVIGRARMCPTCRYFDRDRSPGNRAPHYCRLLEIPLAPVDLRVDCPEHEAA